VAPLVHARYGESTAIVSYATSADGEYTTEMPTAAGTYYVKAYVPATNIYGAAEKVITFMIRKKMIARPAADTTEFTYNGAAQTYGISDTDDYSVTGNVQTNAGTHVVTVTLKDSANTVWDTGLELPLSYDFVIAKKKISDIGNIKFENKRFWFNGKKHSIKISGDLPEGVEVVYSGNGESDLGRFTVTATFVTEDPNYDVSEPMTAVMRIRLNWIPILILILVVLILLGVVITIVEKLLKKEKQEGQNPPVNDGGGGANAPTDAPQENPTEEGENND